MATIEEAIAAIQSGDKVKGREIIAELLKADRNDEQAWLWLTQTDITLEQKIKSLQNVLKINPANEIAKEGLQKLTQRKAEAIQSVPSKESKITVSQITDRLKTKQGRNLLIALGVSIPLLCGICFVCSLFFQSQNSRVSPASIPPIEPTAIPTNAPAPLPTDTPIPTATATQIALPTATNTPVVQPTGTNTAVVQPTATNTQIAQPIIPTATTANVEAAVCDCSANIYDCSAFGSHASAQACYNYCLSIGRGDIHKLDGDSDGEACESLP